MGKDGRVDDLVAAVSRRVVAWGELVVKLPAARVDELVEAGAERFDANKGRPMREWVRLRPAGEQQCEAYAAEARAFVAGEA